MDIYYEYQEIKRPIKKVIATGWWTTSVGDEDIDDFARRIIEGGARMSSCHNSDVFVDRHSVAYRVTLTVEKLK